MVTASSTVYALTSLAGPVAESAFLMICPTPPNSTLANERFIALHIRIDRMRPDEPSSAPAMMSSLLLSTKPIAAADRPAYEFRIAITVGMSAPPIGMSSSTPKPSEAAMSTYSATSWPGLMVR